LANPLLQRYVGALVQTRRNAVYSCNTHASGGLVRAATALWRKWAIHNSPDTLM
jgi:hypothetical protein